MGLLFKKCLLLLKHCANFSQSPPHAFKHNLLDPLELKNVLVATFGNENNVYKHESVRVQHNNNKKESLLSYVRKQHNYTLTSLETLFCVLYVPARTYLRLTIY